MSGAAQQRGSTKSGLGRTLVAVYAVFALAATARSAYQLLTDASAAPLAYGLSAVAAVVYVAATLGLAEVGAVADHLAAVVLPQPGHDHRGVEAAGVGQHHLLHITLRHRLLAPRVQ